MSGPFGSSQWIYNASTGFYPFEISNSLRFNDDDSAFLSRTPSSASNRRTFTFSCWFKYTHGTGQNIWTAGDDVNNRTHVDFNSDGSFQIESKSGGSEQFKLEGTPLFRDSAAWYNLVWAVDTTASSASDRIKAYINGSQVTFSSANYGSQNIDTAINNTVLHVIGKRSYADSNYFNGYFAGDVNFIDGLALTPSSFGETKENIWIPKDTSGLTFGTNGFRLQFKNSSVASASSSTVGADTSGNDHHFSSNNIATTDNMTDSPTDNHATFNPQIIMMNNATSYRGIGSFSDGNLLLTTDADNESGTVPFGASSGKYYMELTSVTLGNRQQIMVFSRDDFRGDSGAVTTSSDGSGNATGRVSWTSGDVIGIAVDLDNSKVFIAKNNTYFGSSNPATNTGGDSLTKFTGVGVRHDSGGTNTTTIRFNGGQLAFTYTPPSGFKSLSTANLPAPAIDPAQDENPLEYWDAELHTGNGGTQEISSFAFQPNWVWIKNRDNADDHYMYDSIRGATKTIHANKSDAEFSSPNALQSFDSDGFTTGGDGGTNRSSQGYVAWAWKAGTSQSFSGESGTSDSTVSSSTEAGFSIVKYTGGSTERVKHGLGAAPEWILVKDLDSASNWAVYHSGLTVNNFVELNTNGTEQAGSNPRFLSSTYSTSVPTSTYFFVRNYSGSTTNNTGNEYIAYCFAPKEGYSAFGIYKDNVIGSDFENTSPFVHTGFRPGWLMIKSIDNFREWVIYDNKRTPDNGVYLTANQNVVEQTDATNHDISFLSNGFKIRGGSGDINTTGESYIYMAFADQPFKFANGGTE